MANTTTSPNMNLPVPTVGVDPGPDWANNVNACLNSSGSSLGSPSNSLDGHNHSPGFGVPINPAGMLINANLPFNGYSVTGLSSSTYTVQATTMPNTVLNAVYDVLGDLWWNNGTGTAVRLTNGGSIVGTSGSITGLPSGTAGVSYASATYTFSSATNQPAAVSVGPVIIGREVTSSPTVTLFPSSGQSTSYALTFPTFTPSMAGSALVSDTSGNLSFSSAGQVPIGSVVATFPNLTGAYTTTATTAGDTSGWVLCQGQTLVDGTSPMNGQTIPNINNTIFLMGNTVSGTSGSGSNQAHTHSFTSTTVVAAANHTHNMSHYHQWMYNNGVAQNSIAAPSTSTGTFTGAAGDTFNVSQAAFVGSGASTYYLQFGNASNVALYTSGSLAQPGGSGASAQTGTESADTTVSGTTNSSGTTPGPIPPYITAVYLMRVR
jgi:hypothetical protein